MHNTFYLLLCGFGHEEWEIINQEVGRENKTWRPSVILSIATLHKIV